MEADNAEYSDEGWPRVVQDALIYKGSFRTGPPVRLERHLPPFSRRNKRSRELAEERGQHDVLMAGRKKARKAYFEKLDKLAKAENSQAHDPGPGTKPAVRTPPAICPTWKKQRDKGTSTTRRAQPPGAKAGPKGVRLAAKSSTKRMVSASTQTITATKNEWQAATALLGLGDLIQADNGADNRHAPSLAHLEMEYPYACSQDVQGQERLKKFLEDCALLGPVRFVSMTEGAILEFVGDFDNIRYSETAKGRYATIMDEEEGMWEVHINVDQVAAAKMLSKTSKDGQYQLYITRLLDKKGTTLLSSMLHGKKGVYEEGAVAYWEKLRTAFGEDQTFS